MKKRIVALLLSAVMAVGMLAGCGGGSDKGAADQGAAAGQEASGSEQKESADAGAETETPVSDEKIDVLNQSETMRMTVVCLQGYTQPDSQIEQWLEERYNLDITVVALPGWSDATAKITLLMTDETQRPDIIWWWNMEEDFVKWVDAGLLVDVAPYMEKYTVMRDYYNDVDPTVLFYAASDDGAIYRIPGDVAEPCCETLWIRQDWLDNLGLQVPTTLDELEDVLYAFTNDDPDGNGVKDTYGLGGDGYDIRSFWPWIQGSGEGYGKDGFVRKADGTYVYGAATEDRRIWLERVAKLYADGVITPNIITDTDRDEEMANGGFGVTHSWVNYNNPSNGTMKSFYATNPDAKWVPIDMVKGDNGNPQDNPCSVPAWCYFGITNVCSDPERAYAIWDDMAQPENYVHRRFGVEGEHYKDNGDGTYEFIITGDSEENNTQNIGIKLFQDLFARKDEYNIDNSKETSELFEKVIANSRDAAKMLVEKKNPAAYVVNNELGTDVGDISKEYMWSVIGGSKSVDSWDSYIKDLEDAGLLEMTDEMTALQNEQSAQLEEYLKTHGN